VGNKRKCKIVIISGPSGAGKNTIGTALIKDCNFLKKTISCTTRMRRYYEIDEKDYYFVTLQNFKKRIKKREFIEWKQVHDEYYGTLKKEVDDIVREGKIPLLLIDVYGAIGVRKKFINPILFFIEPSSMDEIEERIRKRAEISEHDIKVRIKTAEREMQMMNYYDYIIKNSNGNSGKAAEEVIKILSAEVKELSSLVKI